MPLTRRSVLASAVLPVSAAVLSPALAAPRQLRIPHVSARADIDHNYPAQLLKQALAAAGVTVELEPTSELIPQNRALQELGRRGGKLDVLWTMSSVEREQQARAVRVPIYRDLYGWRLLLASPDVAERMREVRSVDELRRFSLVSGLEWPDTGILQGNGLNVVVSASYDAMFKQVRLGRADAFPRSIEEIWWELDRYGQGLVVVPDIVLHYSAPIYFFVAPEDKELAAALETGLQRLHASGAFERLFLQYHGDDVARAKLGTRRAIELVNPLLPQHAPVGKLNTANRP